MASTPTGASAHHEGEAPISQLMAKQAAEVMVSRFEQRQIRVVIA
jgi:hypothetical protein